MTGDYDENDTDFDCYRSLIDGFEAKCGYVRENALKHFKYFFEHC